VNSFRPPSASIDLHHATEESFSARGCRSVATGPKSGDPFSSRGSKPEEASEEESIRGFGGFGGRIHPRHVKSIHNSAQSDDRGSQQQRPQYSSQASGQQQSSFRPPAPRGRGAKGLGGRFGDQSRKIYCLFCGDDKGHTTRMCHVTIQKQKEIAEAAAQQNQPKQVMHTTSYHSPYIPEYVGNHPAASVASASQPQPPPLPPLQPVYSRGQ
jgi:hypothetical protein